MWVHQYYPHSHLSMMTLGSPAQGIMFAGASAARATEGSKDTVSPLPCTLRQILNKRATKGSLKQHIYDIRPDFSCCMYQWICRQPANIGWGRPMFSRNAPSASLLASSCKHIYLYIYICYCSTLTCQVIFKFSCLTLSKGFHLSAISPAILFSSDLDSCHMVANFDNSENQTSFGNMVEICCIWRVSFLCHSE